MSESRRELLLGDVWLSQAPAELSEALMTHGLIRVLRDGETLFRRGEPVEGLYAVLEGALHISGVGREGREAMLSVVEPPMWFGEIALFDRLPRTHDAVAAGATTLLFVPLATIDRLLDAHPEWWRHFGKLMAFKVRLTFIALEDLSIAQPAERLARRLVWLATNAPRPVRNGDHRRLTVKQTELALMMALSRQTVNQLLRALESRGVIRLAYGVIEVLDPVALMDAAVLTPVERRVLLQTGFAQLDQGPGAPASPA